MHAATVKITDSIVKQCNEMQANTVLSFFTEELELQRGDYVRLSIHLSTCLAGTQI
jgi:hypothetical protein